jgi:methionyl-tRNA synthetase
MEFRKAMQTLRSIWSAGNVYLDRKAPWATIREDREATAVTLRTAINLIALYARLSAPVIPATADLLLDRLGVAEDARGWPSEIDLTAIPAGAPLAVPGVLFRKVTDEDTAVWKARFGGGVEQAA